MPEGTTRVLFLPGVSGDGRFWRPVADRLPDGDKALIDFPGYGNVPGTPSVNGFDDLVGLVLSHMDRPSTSGASGAQPVWAFTSNQGDGWL